MNRHFFSGVRRGSGRTMALLVIAVVGGLGYGFYYMVGDLYESQEEKGPNSLDNAQDMVDAGSGKLSSGSNGGINAPATASGAVSAPPSESSQKYAVMEKLELPSYFYGDAMAGGLKSSRESVPSKYYIAVMGERDLTYYVYKVDAETFKSAKEWKKGRQKPTIYQGEDLTAYEKINIVKLAEGEGFEFKTYVEDEIKTHFSKKPEMVKRFL